jgi:hypothetical protein
VSSVLFRVPPKYLPADSYQRALPDPPKVIPPPQKHLSEKGTAVAKEFMSGVEALAGARITPQNMFDSNHAATLRSPEMGQLLQTAGRQMPLADLPGGRAVADQVGALPGAENLKGDISRMSFDELSGAFPKSQLGALEQVVRPAIDGFKQNQPAAFYSLAVATGVVGAVTVGALAQRYGTKPLEAMGVAPRVGIPVAPGASLSVGTTLEPGFRATSAMVGADVTYRPRGVDSVRLTAEATWRRDGNENVAASVEVVDGPVAVGVYGSVDFEGAKVRAGQAATTLALDLGAAGRIDAEASVGTAEEGPVEGRVSAVFTKRF